MISKEKPIGIFDSGIGGLTIASAVTQLLPHEEIIYFGDTAHLPYGEKSIAAIQSYAIKICNLLLEQECKLILIACNSASAAAFDLVKAYVGSRAQVMNVIDPVVDFLREEMPKKVVGLIGTKATVNSGVYQQKIAYANANITLKAMATPLLAAMIEEGFYRNSISQSVLKAYLDAEELEGIEALVLACTHYPLIKSEIEDYYQCKVSVLDPSVLVAKSLQAQLQLRNLLKSTESEAKKTFYVSDYTESFVNSTARFYGSTANLIEYKLWE